MDESVESLIFAKDMEGNGRVGFLMKAAKMKGEMEIEVVFALGGDGKDVQSTKVFFREAIELEGFFAFPAPEKQNTLVVGEVEVLKVGKVFVIEEGPGAHALRMKHLLTAFQADTDLFQGTRLCPQGLG
jgi:hypothetical protein